MQAYYEILTGEDHSKKIEAAKAWSTWEGSTVRLLQDENFILIFQMISLLKHLQGLSVIIL